jgi:hypothetical protein
LNAFFTVALVLNIRFCCKGTRLEDQRSSALPRPPSNTENKKDLANQKSRQGVTLVGQDEDFFNMLQKIQSRRLDEQRSDIPKIIPLSSSVKNGSIL